MSPLPHTHIFTTYSLIFTNILYVQLAFTGVNNNLPLRNMACSFILVKMIIFLFKEQGANSSLKNKQQARFRALLHELLCKLLQSLFQFIWSSQRLFVFKRFNTRFSFGGNNSFHYFSFSYSLILYFKG